jgi:hypothetical protein
MTENAIPTTPLHTRGKVYVGLSLLGIAALWLLALAYILELPEIAPLHFGFSGEPTRFGPKWVLWLLPAAFSIAPVIILLITRYRFRLINDHPYLVNLPAFFVVNLPKLPPARRSWWVNRYFEVNLALGAVITWILVLMEWSILAGTAAGELAGWFIWFSVFALVIPIVGFIFYLRRLGQQMAAEVASLPPSPPDA